MKDNMYDTIVEKLGFEPKDYKPVLSHTEDDSIVNPFSILSVEELRYLKKNNYFKS